MQHILGPTGTRYGWGMPRDYGIKSFRPVSIVNDNGSTSSSVDAGQNQNLMQHANWRQHQVG